MPRIFLPPEQLSGAHVRIEGEALHHLVKVLRLGPGDEVAVFDGQGNEIAARLVSVDTRSAQLALGARRQVAGAPVAITLLQAVPRGDKMDLVVQKTTELGVARVIPVLTARAVARPAADRRRRWETIACAAARQCGRADVPLIDAPIGLIEALAGLHIGTRLVLWEEERATPLRRALGGSEPEVAVLVGPEGGFADHEIAAVRASGWISVGLGPRILRSETAGIIAVALAQAAAGGLD